MALALREAGDAFARGDWPVGSVLVRDGIVLATGQNRQNTERDPTWHAEFEAMRRAMQAHGADTLAGATVYSGEIAWTDSPATADLIAGSDAILANIDAGRWPARARARGAGYRFSGSSSTRCRMAGLSRSTATRSARRPCTPWSSPRSSSSTSLVR